MDATKTTERSGKFSLYEGHVTLEAGKQLKSINTMYSDFSLKWCLQVVVLHGYTGGAKDPDVQAEAGWPGGRKCLMFS